MLELPEQSEDVEKNTAGKAMMIKQDDETSKNKKTKLRAPRRLVSVREELRTIKQIEDSGSRKQFVFARYLLIITSICLTVLGCYILFNHEEYLGEKIDFDYSKTLLVFLCIYTSGIIGTFIISYILGIFISICFRCCYFKAEPAKKEPQKSAEFIDPTVSTNQFNIEQLPNENNIDENDTNILANVVVEADRITILPYAMNVFIILTIVLYFAALPFAGFVFYVLITDQYLGDIKKYWPLYTACILSFLNGLIILIVLLVMLCITKRSNDILKKNMELDENHITELRNEVRLALKNAK